MPISQQLMPNQIVSLSSYQRLSDSLIQQAHLFESVITDTQWVRAQRSASSRHLVVRSGIQFVAMRSQALSVLLLALPAAAADASAAPSRANAQYQLRLIFERSLVEDFISQLNSGVIASWVFTQDRPATSPSTPESVLTSVQSKEHEALVLAWTKQLAHSPEGDPQPKNSAVQAKLNTQTQQSLLLNQVITRIRYSLDLPAILETTVAQVREFLSADRLVLHQFEQLDLADLPHSSDNQTSDDHTSAQAELKDKRHSHHHHATPNTNPNNGMVIGQCVHEGHVTYESRVSEDIPSVLDYAERQCFQPALSIRDRYILGQPIAVDDVETQYQNTPCLLAFLRQAQVKSKIIAPIVVQGQLWGLLIAHQCTTHRHWEETEGLFLQHIAEHLAVAISQAALYHQLRAQTVRLESCVVERTQNLHDALMAAESANLTKGEFLSTMSHELRTPLTYIIGMSATLLRWSFGDLSERQRSYLNTINHSGEQLLNIINDILEFAKVESGRSLLDFSDFSLSALIDNVVSHYRDLADKQGVKLTLTLNIGDESDRFRADAKRLEQILSNLIHNAIKFTPAAGCVSLNIWQEAQVTVFEINDTGIGIPESQRGLLFEKFKQLESPFQRQYSGTGLGLAMTKRLVELHGGSIHVDSTVGQGSTFTVRLPLQSAILSKVRYEVPSTLASRPNRILLFELEEDTAGIVCDLLTADGYEVIWLVESEQLLTQLSSLQPAMLIADLSLLSHNLDDIKSIQLSITAMGAKVLALLGQPVSHSSHIAHHDTLEKPIDPKCLLEKVRQLTL